MARQRPLFRALRRTLTAGAVLSGATPLLFGAEAEDQELYEGERFTVTGSRILRAEIEGANPVTIITREDLEATGEISVADVIRQTTYNTFGSFRESSTEVFVPVMPSGFSSIETTRPGTPRHIIRFLSSSSSLRRPSPGQS